MDAISVALGSRWAAIVVAGLLAFALLLPAVLISRLVSYRRQIERVRDELESIAAGAAERVVVTGGPDPLADIAASVNGLLERADASDDRAANVENSFAVLAATVPEVALIHTDVILYANQAAADLFGVEPAALQGKSVTDLLRPAYRALMRKRVTDELQSQSPLEPMEVQLISGDENRLWVELHSRRLSFNGQPAFVSVARDITHRKGLEASLGRGKLQARVTLESIGEGVITTDAEGTIDYMNEAAEQLLDCKRSAAIGRTTTDLMALVDEADGDSLGDPVAQCLAERRRINLGRRARLVSKGSKKEFATELTASPIRSPDGEIAGCVVIFHDVSEIRGLTREMSYQASHDPLTGLVNRAEFRRRLDQALAAPRGEHATHVVCYLDLDRFKAVNDSFGHMVGDNLLRELATLLKNQVRESDTVARLGGDEFAMLLVGCPLDKARQIAEDVCHAVSDYNFTWQDRVFELGVSIGIVEILSDSGTAETALRAADSACYVAKQQGRGRVHVYSARDEIMARERGEIRWLQRVQNALKENQFELYSQSIIATRGRVERGPAAELFLRMIDETGKVVAPAQFLSAAERYQLMSHLDRWVVRAALTSLAADMPHVPAGRSCSINLSGQTLGDEEFLEYVVDLLDHTGVDPGKVCFEISETAVMNNIDLARRFINVLHGMGCRFALDDFGSGIGSFSQLRLLAIDYLKVDGSFTRDVAENRVSREMLAATISLSRSLDFLVVAEQVEDQESFDALRQLGVDFIQGYVVERPHPLGRMH
ncbi:MAG: EAL domain-containing protein [Gammaproteobacteria bacterium]|jgi:diguanylate cyclase (GGDEF)-like protein/PAS domain S-box-containing protein